MQVWLGEEHSFWYDTVTFCLKNMLFSARYWFIISSVIIGMLPTVSRGVGLDTATISVQSTTPVFASATQTASLAKEMTTSSTFFLATSSAVMSDFIIRASDIARVFTAPEEIKSVGGRFEQPVWYFRVGEHLTREEVPRDCADCDNLVAIFVSSVMPTSTPAWVATANPEIRRAGGRLHMRWFAANRLISVTAPGTVETVTALGSWLRERAILGKIN